MPFFTPRDSVEEYKLRAKFAGINDLTGGYPSDSIFLNNKIIEKLDLTSSQVLVDIGCGNGYLLDKVKEKIARGIGVSPSLEECNLLQKKFSLSPNIEIKTGVLLNLSSITDSTADIVICNGVLLYLKDISEIEKALKEINRISKNNAEIFIGCLPENVEHTESFIKKVFFSFKNNSIFYTIKLAWQYFLAIMGMKIIILPSPVININQKKFEEICMKSGLLISNHHPTPSPPGKGSFNYRNRRDYWMKKIKQHNQ